MKTLVAGWFSFQEGHATAGDLLTRDLARAWLESAGHHCDVALAAPFRGGVDWRQVDPEVYSHVVFVCGPFQRSNLEVEFLQRFARCRLLGLNLSMQEPLSEWNPFDLLLERDSSEGVRPDMGFASPPARVPVVGVCLVEAYSGGLVEVANTAIRRLIESREMAPVDIDTRLDAHSKNPLRTPAEIESVIARVDVLLTTRLHGLVLGLKNSTPVIAIDPEPGGAKINRQAKLLGWPASFVVDELEDPSLQESFEYCLQDGARAKARDCCQRAQAMLHEMRKAFVTELREGRALEKRYRARLAKGSQGDPGTRPGQTGGRSTGSFAYWWDRIKDAWMKGRQGDRSR